MRFTKMHGIGNDYIYVNAFEEKIAEPEKLAVTVSDRHTGIGGDGLILICPSAGSTTLTASKADVRMRMFNADGSESEMCGNGIRCVAKYAFERGLAKSRGPFTVCGGANYPASLAIETGKGVLTVGIITDKRQKVTKVCVNMGEPILEPRKIPVNLDGDRIIERPITIGGHELIMTCVSMGNPHSVFFCDSPNTIELEKIGPLIEHNAIFPSRVNAHFVRIDGPNEFTMRTWERGSGITMACGTGACACCVAAVLTERTKRICRGHLPGGDLELYWCEKDNCVYMTGPAVEVFEGVWP